jgi:hypothetical protein
MTDIIPSLLTVCLYLCQLIFCNLLILYMLLYAYGWYVYAQAHVTLVIDAGAQFCTACVCYHSPESKPLTALLGGQCHNLISFALNVVTIPVESWYSSYKYCLSDKVLHITLVGMCMVGIMPHVVKLISIFQQVCIYPSQAIVSNSKC